MGKKVATKKAPAKAAASVQNSVVVDGNEVAIEFEDENPELDKFIAKYADKDGGIRFLWGSKIKLRTVVMKSSAVVYTAHGGRRVGVSKTLKVKNGMYCTSDREEIDFIRSHEDFRSPLKTERIDVMGQRSATLLNKMIDNKLANEELA